MFFLSFDFSSYWINQSCPKNFGICRARCAGREKSLFLILYHIFLKMSRPPFTLVSGAYEVGKKVARSSKNFPYVAPVGNTGLLDRGRGVKQVGSHIGAYELTFGKNRRHMRLLEAREFCHMGWVGAENRLSLSLPAGL